MRIGILGAGISGLTVAKELSREHDVTVFEKADRVGGWLQTEQVGAFQFERGPRSFKTSSCQALLELASDLGLTIVPSSTKGRYLWIDGELQSWLSPLFSLKGLLALLREWSVAPHHEEETIWEFACRRFNRSIAEKLFDPLTLGIYGGDIRKLSMNCCFSLFKELEQEYGSLTKALFKRKKKKSSPSLFSFEGGAHSLIQQLSEKSCADILLNCAVTALHFHESEVEVVTEKGSFHFDFLFSALPPQVLGQLLQPTIPEMAELLLSIELLSLTVINLGYQDNVLSKKGFGYLIPTSEREEILGCVFDSMIFPSEKTSLSVMVRGVDKSDQEYLEIAQRSLKKQLEIAMPPDRFLITRAERAIPQYTVGHQLRIRQLLEKCPSRVRLTGNYFHGVSVNECIARARQEAAQFLKEFEKSLLE